MYTTLLVTGQLHSPRIRSLTYRCAERCTLLDVFEVPGGAVIVGFPRYKTSPEQTEQTSSAAGRARNTEDGDRRWKGHAAVIESVSNPPLSCDHVRSVALSDEQLESHWTSGHVEVRVRRDGTMYAVHSV